MSLTGPLAASSRAPGWTRRDTRPVDVTGHGTMRSISTRRFREPVEIRPQFGADVVSPAPALRERPRVRVNALDDRVGESVEERPILGWHPEQMADHADGRR
jgi:hypothetical protein